MRTRFATWLVCGPLGHLVAGATDVTVALVRWRLARRQASSRAISPR
jgi:hypothetical protein